MTLQWKTRVGRTSNKAVGIGLLKNCVFVDQAGFHSQMMKNRAWSKAGEPAKVKVHNQKNANVSTIGYIAARYIIDFPKLNH